MRLGMWHGVRGLMRVLAVGWIFVFAIQAGDWPQWRGMNRDGAVSRNEHLLSSLPTEPKVRWKIRTGVGWASPVVAQGRVFYADAQNGRETLHAVRTQDGSELWRADIDAVMHDEQGPDGPRGTPLVVGELVFYQSCLGELQCRRVSDGQLVWRTNFQKDFGSPWKGEDSPIPGAAEHGYTASPVWSEGRLLVTVGSTNGAGIVAFESATGAVLWKSQNDLAAYAASVVADVAGQSQLIAFVVEGLVGMKPEDGSVLWRYPLKTSYGRNCLTPVVLGDMVVTGSYQAGLRGVRLQKQGDRSWQAEAQWTNAAAAMNFSSPVVVQGFVFGVGPAKNLVCVEAATGRLAWSQEGLFAGAAGSSYGALLVIGENLLLATDGGLLVLLAANPTEFRELGRVQVGGRSWSHPAYSDGTLYWADGLSGPGYLRSIELSPAPGKEGSPKPK